MESKRMKIEITDHASQRFKQRFNSGKHTIDTIVLRAMNSERTSPSLKFLRGRKKRGFIYRLYAECIFVFQDKNMGRYILKTVIPHDSERHMRMAYKGLAK